MSELTDEDSRALDRAVDLACLDATEKAKIEARFEAGDAWRDVAVDCARHLQRKNLALRPWENVPMHGDIDQPRRDQHAYELLQRLSSLGLSRYEPQPLAAIERATARQKAPAK